MPSQTRQPKTKPITIPLTPYDLTVTTFFATQQLFTNLGNTQDPTFLLNDIAECLHVSPQDISHLPIGSWDDRIIKAILNDSFLESNNKQTSTTKDNQTPETSETSKPGNIGDSISLVSITNTNQTIDTLNPQVKDQISLLGIASHLSSLVSELSIIAKEMLEVEKNKKKHKPNSIAAHKASKNSSKKKKLKTNIKETYKTLDEMLPLAVSFYYKGNKYFLLGREADASFGKVPVNKLTVAEYVTMEELRRSADAQKPERDAKGEILVQREILAPNGKDTGKRLTDEQVKNKQYTENLRDIDISFNLNIRQMAVLCRRAHETLPQQINEREAYITERARMFAEAPAWIAFVVRSFFIERLTVYSLIPDVNLIAKDGELRRQLAQASKVSKPS